MNAYDQTRSRSSSLGAHKYSIESDEDVNVCWYTLLFMCMHVCVFTGLFEDSLIGNDYGAEAVKH